MALGMLRFSPGGVHWWVHGVCGSNIPQPRTWLVSRARLIQAGGGVAGKSARRPQWLIVAGSASIIPVSVGFTRPAFHLSRFSCPSTLELPCLSRSAMPSIQRTPDRRLTASSLSRLPSLPRHPPRSLRQRCPGARTVHSPPHSMTLPSHRPVAWRLHRGCGAWPCALRGRCVGRSGFCVHWSRENAVGSTMCAFRGPNWISGGPRAHPPARRLRVRRPIVIPTTGPSIRV